MDEKLVKTNADRRGRIYAAGIFVGFESEVETFKALADKYLKGTLTEISLLSDPPQTLFEVKVSNDER